jgi:cytoskeletal protein RodZ
VNRLWSRFGTRSVAIGVLVLSLVGGVLLGTNRQAEQQRTAAIRLDASDVDEMHQLKVDLATRARLAAPQRQAQADAQAKADAAAAQAATKAQQADTAARQAQAASRSNTRTSPAVNVPTSCAAYTGNRAIGCALVLQAGMDLTQMACLDPMWTKESGWNEKSKNGSSGAYGIPQSLPASKMSVYGSDYLTNPATQIKWGLSYIKNRYTNPCGAWSFWQAHHYY